MKFPLEFDINSRIQKINVRKKSTNNHFQKNSISHYILESKPLRANKKLLTNNSFYSILADRKSSTKLEVRSRIDYESFSTLLSISYGFVNGQHRGVPSAGGMYSIRPYIFVFNVEELQPGIYHYNYINNCIDLITEGDFREELINAFYQKDHINECSFLIAHIGDFKPHIEKYGDRGYKLIHMDLGHISQNVYLGSSALNFGCRALFGYHEELLNNLLDINKIHESTLLTHVIGIEKKDVFTMWDIKESSIYVNRG